MSPREAFNAMVATAHPLATETGIEILKRGGNCVDAAIAVAAALNVVDMSNTGIGGDAFALVYFREEGRVVGLNASGRSPFTATVEKYERRGHFAVPERGPLSVTTPGALSGWTMLHERYATMPFAALLQPAVALAQNGFEINNMTRDKKFHAKPYPEFMAKLISAGGLIEYTKQRLASRRT